MPIIVDAEDLYLLDKYTWSMSHNGEEDAALYAMSYVDGSPVYLHRLILGVTDPSVLVDHRNTQTLDNRKSNLRICSKAENGWNRGKTKANTTGFKGVYRHKNKYKACIGVNYEQRYLGLFSSPEEAYSAYLQAATKYHGEFAHG